MTTTSHAATPATNQLHVLVAVCLAALVLPLSFSGGAVVTPFVGLELGGSATALSWITSAFMLTFGSLLMAAGAVADQFGRKRVFITGLASFTMLSMILSGSQTVLAVDLLRGALGVAAAAALAGGTAALAQEFGGASRVGAFSLLGTTFGAGLAFGPVLAGLLAERFGWRAVFLSPALVGALALVFAAPRLRETRNPDAVGLDWPGVVSFTVMLACFTFGVILGPERGWSNGLVLALFTASAITLALFVVIELRAERPMLDLALFRYPRFVGVQVLPIATCYGYVVLLVLLPLRFIGIEGMGALDAGMLVMVLSLPMLVVPWLGARLAHRFSAGAIAGAGLLAAAAGLFWLRACTQAGQSQAAAAPLLLIGFGTGLPWGLMDGLSVSVVPQERAGMATGIFSTARVAGEGIALAVVIAALSTFSQARLHATLEATAGLAATPLLTERIVAQHLAVGDLRGAASLLPQADAALLVQVYIEAFRTLLGLLAALTTVSALVVFAFLRGTEPNHPIRS